MKAGNLFGSTLKESPRDSDAASDTLLVRGGFVRKVAAGVYAWLPMGLRVLHNVQQIVRQEMNAIGASEMLMPALLPAELLQKTGRWETFGDELYRLKDAANRDWYLGPTHEEVVTAIANRELTSYRDLPKTVFQTQWKYRYAARPRGGLLRSREFLMKDAYSFDADEDGMRKSYERMVGVYARALDRCGLEARLVDADAGVMGGGFNQEFIVESSTGDTEFVACSSCDYAATTEGNDHENEAARCRECDGRLSSRRGIEIGHVFQLGPKYSVAMGAGFTSQGGSESPFLMGCYGFGISRAVAAIAETHNDVRGIFWPREVAPYEVVITLISSSEAAEQAALRLSDELEGGGFRVVLDDRDISAGAKFADADLIGYPIRVVFGRLFEDTGKIEAIVRGTGERIEIDAKFSEVKELLESRT